MSKHIHDFIVKATGAKSVFRREVVQRLWRGYGEIVCYGLTGSHIDSVIVKHIKLAEHSRSAKDFSHQRKIRSYQVEMAWYRFWSTRCDSNCRIPACLAYQSFGGEVLIVLEDLDAVGYPQRRSVVSQQEINACLDWLANFHASFIGEQPEHLWPIGTYWHLATRPDELNALQDVALKNAAAAIDEKLRNCRYQTLVHGDAKLENFCFSKDGRQVAAVDFQYVGGGCGIKDVAYFIDSCLSENDLFHCSKASLKTKAKSCRC